MSSGEYSSKHDFVDDFSFRVEEMGHPRIYGQILGWLLICDPPHQSFPDLMENLDISKASVSNTTRMMLETGLIEKVRVKGERQTYFKLKEGSLIEFLEKQLQITLSLKSITQKGIDFLEGEEDTDPTRLKKAHTFHTFLARELPSLMEKFKKEYDL